MRIDIITLFPEAVRGYLDASIVGRARRRGLLEAAPVDPRQWAGGRHRVVDDRPYGGGPGMVLAAPPIASCIEALQSRSSRMRLLMTSPQGRPLDQAWASELAQEQHLAVICGHYEGVDERINEIYRPEEFSIGDFVLSGGELAALVLTDAVTRLLPGALGHDESAVSDSFSGDEAQLDHPCYTRPVEFNGMRVPDVLLSGDHAKIEAWRREQRELRTAARRPDLKG
ncbi:MAG: tRNA (guanosine(37)-N1)-methyltransferase TrmD [Planctomycetota bacterium]|jgi:tRNA (guanine37-N1)-methyltransferase|nr:tRNA (guanosine(37)-N1)-methyltransferase TrmD [Planctomycetota bacterium]